MSNVSVPIEANPTSAVSAINAIKQATRDAAKEQGALADELARVNAQFDQLQKVNAGLGRKLKDTGQQSTPFHAVDWDRMYGPNAPAARTEATRFVTHGTRWQPLADTSPSADHPGHGEGRIPASGALSNPDDPIKTPKDQHFPGLASKANPTNAVSAINAIKQATRHATKDNKELADQLERVNKQFDRLLKVDQGLRSRVKATGQADIPFADLDWRQMYGDPRTADRARTQATKYVTQGTQWQTAPQGPQWQTAPQGPVPAAPEGGGGMSALLALGGRLLTPLAALLIAHKAINYAGEGERSAETQAIETDELMRSLGGAASEFETFRDTIREVGRDIGMTSTEAIALSKEFSHLTGIAESEQLAKEADRVATFGRSFGMNPMESAGMFGRMQWALGTKSDQKELARLIAESVVSGKMWGKTDEVMGAITRFVEHATRYTVNQPDIAAFAELKAKLDSSDLPGMRGQAAESLIMSVDQGFRGEQGEGAASFFAYALNPDNHLRYLELERLKQEGPFASEKSVFPDKEGASSVRSIDKLMPAIRSSIADPLMRQTLMAAIFPGMSMAHAEQFEKLYWSMQDKDGNAFGKLGEDLQKAGIPLGSVPQEAWQELGGLSQIPDSGLVNFKDKFLETHPKISTFHKNRLNMPSVANDPVALRNQLMVAISGKETGMAETEGEGIRKSLSEKERAQTGVGEHFTDAAKIIRDAGTTLSGGADKFYTAVELLVKKLDESFLSPKNQELRLPEAN